MNHIKIRKAQLFDCLSLAKIHKECLDKSFLGKLGEKFLTLLYKTLVECEECILFVAEDARIVIGFVSGTSNISDLYGYFFKRNFIKLPFLLLPKLINTSLLKKALETLQYPTKKNLEIPLPEAELLSIAVKEGYQGKGISEQLFRTLVDEFHKIGIKELKIIVGTSLPKSQKFYKKMGCIKLGEFELHKGEISEAYIFKK